MELPARLLLESYGVVSSLSWSEVLVSWPSSASSAGGNILEDNMKSLINTNICFH